MSSTVARPAPSPVRTGLWFALVLGLAEVGAIGLLKIVRHKYIHYNVHQFWAATIANALLFAPIMLVLALVARRTGRDVAFRWALALFAGLSAYGVLLNLPALAEWAVLLLSLGVGVQAFRMADGLAPLADRVMRATTWPMVAVVAGIFAWVTLAPLVRERRMVGALGEAPAAAPNVLLLILDTVRARSMSLYGYQRSTTPRIAEFALRGVTFSRAVSPAPWTLPGHASMLTGHLPDEVGVDWGRPYDGRFPLLAEVMADYGYRTAAFTANTHYLTPESGLDRGFAHFEADRLTPAMFLWASTIGRRLLRLAPLRPLLQWSDRPGRKDAAEMKREVLRWTDPSSARPFFVMVNYYDAHSPYLPPAPYDSVFGSRGQPRNYQLEQRDSLPQGAGQVEQNAYDGALAYLDHEIGALLDSLESRHQLEHTLVIITSDHGEEFLEHGWFGHGNTLYMTTLHVPLVIAGPGIAPVGATNAVVSTRNVAATVLDLAIGGGEVARVAGRTIAGAWRDPASFLPDTAISQLNSDSRMQQIFPGSRGDMDAVLGGDFHLIRNGGGEFNLYDWSADTLEQHDLAADGTMAQVMMRLDRHMRPNPASADRASAVAVGGVIR